MTPSQAVSEPMHRIYSIVSCRHVQAALVCKSQEML